MHTSSLLIGIVGAGIVALPALAQDHPCVRPQDQFVVALCGDPELRSIADQQRDAMMALWNRLAPEEQDKFRKEQIAWRDLTARRCGVDQPLSAETKNCLRQAETRRIEFLRHYGQTDAANALHQNALPQVTSPTSVAVTDNQGATAYQGGLRDRDAWENWFGTLQGDYKTGAFYWASQRSLPNPGSCKQMNDQFYAGCAEAKVKLAAADALRKTEPNYKAGWNAWAPSGVAPIPAPGPAVPHDADVSAHIEDRTPAKSTKNVRNPGISSLAAPTPPLTVPQQSEKTRVRKDTTPSITIISYSKPAVNGWSLLVPSNTAFWGGTSRWT
jgi:hypothetical protein